MQKTILSLCTIMIAITLFFAAAVPVMADNGKNQGLTQSTRAELMIRMVDKVDAGQPVAITVLSKHDHNTVSQAMVYALNPGQITMTADAANYNATGESYADIAVRQGLFLGYTGDDGRVEYTFEETGRYIIVAIKDGYMPGYYKITVSSVQASLVIRVPDSAQVDEEVKIMVAERGTGDAVSGAAVYAMKRLSNVQTLNKNTVQLQNKVAVKSTAVAVKVASSNQTTTSEIAVAYPSVEEVKERGIFLGNTGDEGLIVHAFEAAGRYVIVAVCEGYTPGFSDINITNTNLNQLYIRVPSTAIVNQEITIAVVERNTHKPVEDVAVYATMIIPVSVSSAAVNDDGTASQVVLQADGTISDNSTDEIPVRELLGYTDERGQLVYAFAESGRYNITGVKDGYTSASVVISVLLSAPAELKVALPARAGINENINIKVWNRYNSNPEEDAAVYALEYNSTVRELYPVVSGNETDISSRAEIYADMALSTGIYIGDTDENGEVTYAFTSVGQYLVVAIKEGFIPGFNKISVLGMVNGSLLLRVQDEAKVNVPVIIATVDKVTSDEVSDVDIYAYKMRGFAASLGFTFREAFSFGNTARQNLAMSVSDDGFYIGTTDEIGVLEYAFDEEGQYLLIAFKAGYSPDFERIKVVSTESE
jgi:hypothetical protein